jgi:hypothetical protein
VWQIEDREVKSAEMTVNHLGGRIIAKLEQVQRSSTIQISDRDSLKQMPNAVFQQFDGPLQGAQLSNPRYRHGQAQVK